MVTEFLVTLATFDLLPTHLIDNEIYYFPSDEPYTPNFESSGLESEIFLANIGFVLWFLMSNVLLALIHLVLRIFKDKCNNKRIDSLYDKIGSSLYWNGLQRMYMEFYFDIAIISTLNLKT